MFFNISFLGCWETRKMPTYKGVPVPNELEYETNLFLVPGCYQNDLKSVIIPEGLIRDRVKQLAREIHNEIGDQVEFLQCDCKLIWLFSHWLCCVCWRAHTDSSQLLLMNWLLQDMLANHLLLLILWEQRATKIRNPRESWNLSDWQASMSLRMRMSWWVFSLIIPTPNLCDGMISDCRRHCGQRCDNVEIDKHNQKFRSKTMLDISAPL